MTVEKLCAGTGRSDNEVPPWSESDHDDCFGGDSLIWGMLGDAVQNIVAHYAPGDS